MTRLEFLQRRKSGIGGSDVAAILGLSPWRSPLDVYYDKTEPLDPHAVDASPVGEDRALYWGTVLEAEIARAYTAVTGRKLTRYNRLLQHPDYPWAIGDVDRLVVPENGKRAFNPKTGEIYTDRAVEIKNSRYKGEEWGDDGSDVIPVWYYCQVQWYMMLMPTVEIIDTAPLFCGQDFQRFPVSRDDDFIAKMFPPVRDFYENNIEKRIPPAPRSLEDVAKLYPSANVPKITASAELEADVRELVKATAARKNAEKAESEIKFRVAAAMGAAELAELPDGTPLVTYKNTARGGRLLSAKIKVA